MGQEVCFGRFRLHLEQRKLSRDGEPVPLSGRPFEILCALAAAQGDIVTKDNLIERVWGGVIVGENAIQVHVSALRKVLGEGVVETAQGRGYRLVGLKRDPAISSQLPLPLPDRPSIAVLPFQNMSSDPEQDYFADGMVDDIVTGLARIRWLFVIARNSSFIYKGRAVDVRQVGQELGVRYLLEGGVRKAGNLVRVSAQLIEAETGAQLWAQRYERTLDDIFAVQDEIAMSVVSAIEPNLRKVEIERVKRSRPDNLLAYDLVLRALPIVCNMMAEQVAAAAPLLEKALEFEPDYAFAHAALAWCHHSRYSRGNHSTDERDAAIHHARAAVSSGADDASALAIAGLVLWFDAGDGAAARDLFDRALTLSHSNIFALCCSAVPLAWMGHSEAAVERAQRALRISPFDSLNYLSYDALAISRFLNRNYEQALDAARRAAESNPRFIMPQLFQAAALVRLGRNEAKDAVRRARTLDPHLTIQKYAVVNGHVADVFLPFAEAWRDAGMPEG